MFQTTSQIAFETPILIDLPIQTGDFSLVPVGREQAIFLVEK